MTEEENKAIKTINLFLNKPVRFKNKNIIANNEIEAIDTLLNLIEKLQKENLLLRAKENMSAYFEFKRNYIPKDKIRELFKELYIIEESKYAKNKTIDSDKAFKFVKDIEKLLEEE